jgi:hypothetical protein
VETLPEPKGGRELRISDADRDQVADVLREAVAHGRLTLAELDERLTLAYAAKTYGDLEEVVVDLPRAPRPTTTMQPVSRRWSLAVMSGTKRSGRWVVPARYTAVAFMGGVELDLRHAVFSEREVTIAAYCLMGGVVVIVPDDVEVDVSGLAFMGGFDHRASSPGPPGAPVIRVTGFAFMGGVEVRRRTARPES